MKKYWLEKYQKWIDYDGTAEGLVRAIKADEDILLERSVDRLVDSTEGWMQCYIEDTEGRRVKGGGGTESTGRAKNSKAIMARKENRWPDWREE